MSYANARPVVADSFSRNFNFDPSIEIVQRHGDASIERYQADLVVSVYAKDIAAIRSTFRSSYAAQLLESLHKPRYSPVHAAVLVNDSAVLFALAEQLPAALLDVRDEIGRTPLMFAATLNRTADIHILMSAHVSASEVDSEGRSALMLAAQLGYAESIDALLVDSDTTPCVDRVRDIDQQDSQGNTALMHAIRGGHYEAVETLLKYSANTNVANFSGVRVLNVAIAQGFHRIVKLLCSQASLDIDAVDSHGLTALMYAAHYATKTYDSSIVNLLLSRNASADVKSRDGDTVLLREAKGGSDFTIEHLVYGGARVDQTDAAGRCAIALAAKHNNLSVLRYLLTLSGVNVDRFDHGGRTPLFHAVVSGNREAAHALLRHGASINLSISATGESLLALARLQNKDELVSLLLMYGGSDLNEVSENSVCRV
jgi:ankyrin repeat protein